ncbi:monosaccharide ABC transporter membrane protein (CUT2 family) [Motilibacter rhizosphaerae]|uniref:Autoinducer 2 import system permease protein LsrD n=1 Tax=Motilibacter rhizosphaerae TaxID=598652 RepID=A0A4Q7NV09_9ACTN|nr:ABC transporter permease [Motilibacter rhizosphaerae]RZS91061.1 monosaccharide ABC transporter membrane protein (CUT2 family) [Motilibacter rhizosphaerae]
MAPDRTGTLRRSLLTWDVAVVVVLAVVIAVASGSVDSFASQRNWGFLLLDLVPIALIALPMTLVVITGEIDLSVASTLGLVSAAAGKMWADTTLPLTLIVVLCVLLGALLGAVNGVFVTRFGLPSLAVTIGTLALYRGLAFVVLGDRAVADFPTGWTDGAVGFLPGTRIPWVVLPLLALVLVFALVLHATPVGRALYAMGNSTDAATFAGIDVARTKMWLYVVIGAVSGVAGVFWTFRYASARADNGNGLELQVVAGVLLGGVSIFGGRGGLLGVVAGVLLLGTLRNALQLDNVSADALTVVTGGLLIVSVLLPNAAAWLRSTTAQRSRRAGANPVTPASSANPA